MKVLHIHPSMASGGIEAMICSLANEMVKICSTTVCSIFEVKKDHIFWNKLSPDVKKKSLGKLHTGFTLKEVWKIYKFIKKEGFDVVYLHGHIQYYLLAVILLHNSVCFCYTIHSDAEKENIGWSRRLFKLKRFCFSNRWIIPITISHASQESFTKLYKCSSELIYNGVPRYQGKTSDIPDIIKQYHITSKTLVLIHPGRISIEKNQIVLCKVFKRLIDEGEDVVLLIAGSNVDKLIFNEISLYFNKRIVYIGLRDDIPNLLAYADGLCLPSIWEGLPVVLLEALSVGCIPICSPVGGIVNVIETGKNGLLSLSSNESDYYEAMKRFLKFSNNERQQMKLNCIDSFNKYDISNVGKNYIEVAKKCRCLLNIS